MERFVMLQEDESIAKVENYAKRSGCTKSWIIRSVLKALEKKFASGLSDKYEIKRPKKFHKNFRQTTICFYGDKNKWFSLCRIWKVELGPLIRFGLDLFEAGELELDLDNEETVKEVKIVNRGKKYRKKIRNNKVKRFTYMYHNQNECYSNEEFWLKNPGRNLVLMELGLRNRNYPLILSEDFQIPECFGG